MAKIDLKDLILPVELENTDENLEEGNKAFNTKDRVFLNSIDDILKLSKEEKQAAATDYAVMTGAMVFNENSNCHYWLRTNCFYYHNIVNVHIVKYDGYVNVKKASIDGICIRPVLHLNLSMFISAKRNLRDFGKIVLSKETNKYQIELGEYPKGHASNSDELEKLYKKGSLKKTGKVYTGYMNKDGTYTKNIEFEYKDKRYVRVVCKNYEECSHFSDGTKEPKTGKVAWAVVEPILWNINNWNELPHQINPEGSGKATYIDIQTDEGIFSGIPFHLGSEYDVGFDPMWQDRLNLIRTDLIGFDSMWQNSLIRAYLNGYNLHKVIEKGNGNNEYRHSHNYNFERGGFLKEAGLDGELVLNNTDEEQPVM